MPQVAIVFSGTQDVLVANYQAVSTAIVNSGLTVASGVIPIGGEETVPDTTTLLNRITNFRLFVRLVLSGTRAQFDALIVSLQAIKSANPGLSFSVSLLDTSAL